MSSVSLPMVLLFVHRFTPFLVFLLLLLLVFLCFVYGILSDDQVRQHSSKLKASDNLNAPDRNLPFVYLLHLLPHHHTHHPRQPTFHANPQDPAHWDSQAATAPNASEGHFWRVR
jgi:phosphoglycerol transferase MdoB-like AlkP superfamily enzyme